MKMVPLGEIAQINPRLPKAVRNGEDKAVAFLPMAAVLEDGTIAEEETRPLSEVLKGYTYFERDDIIIAKITPCFENGKAAHLRTLGTQVGFGSTEFHVLRPGRYLDARYLFHMVWNPRFRFVGSKKMAGAAGQKRVPVDAVRDYKIPLPPLPEQKRIAAILDKADAIRRKRRQALALADQFLRAVFLDMFGDPVTNPKGWRKEPLSKVVRFVSGGTPSKDRADFWDGTFPWVSPKDMKSIEIDDAEDHVSDAAFAETSLKVIPERALLIVVRGMILAHTVPVAITTSQVAINQDMKAMIVKNAIIPEFALYCLRVQHSHLLSKISTAAHGTKRFDMQDLNSIGMLVPDRGLQDKFGKIVLKFRTHQHKSGDSVAGLKDLFGSLTQRAFRGEL